VEARGHPAFAEAHGAADGVGRCAADYDRRPLRAGAEPERLPVRLHLVGGKAGMEEGERGIGDRAAPSWVHAERPELLLHPADPDAEDQPLRGQLLDRCDPLGSQQSGTVGDDQHAHAQAHPFGDPGEKGQGRQRLEVAPARAFRILGRQRHMIGDPEIVDARLLGGSGRICDERAGRQRTEVAQGQAELHAVLRLRGAGAMVDRIVPWAAGSDGQADLIPATSAAMRPAGSSAGIDA
jgi:hypothetical protein